MKKLILKIISLLILVGVVNAIINHFFYDKKLPYYWGNETISSKRNFLVKNKAHFNTLFIGSSKTKYQIDPILFDSIVNKTNNGNIHSYNLGIDYMMPPESFYIYKSLLDNDSLHLKNVIIEIDFFRKAETENLFTWRNYYWVNPGTYYDYTSSLLSSHYTPLLKAWNLTIVNIMAVTKIYNIGKFNEYVQFKKNQFSINKTFEGENGFVGLPHRIEQQSKLEEVKNASITAYSNYDKWSSMKKNQAFFNSLEKIIQLSNKKGVRLIFLLPIQWQSMQYKELFPILKAIPNRNKLEIADYSEYKPLFNADISFDYAHLDSVGARIYTRDVAQAFGKIY